VPLDFTLWEAIFCAVIISYGKAPALFVAVTEPWTSAETVFGVTSTFALEK
jgi:hypothetical protein